MARSHHRKKHKEHLRQFKHSQDISTIKSKSKASGVFSFVGLIIGTVISYFAANGSVLWILTGAIIGGLLGFVLGRRIDKDK